jgi:hypothetical protein
LTTALAHHIGVIRWQHHGVQSSVSNMNPRLKIFLVMALIVVTSFLTQWSPFEYISLAARLAFFGLLAVHLSFATPERRKETKRQVVRAATAKDNSKASVEALRRHAADHRAGTKSAPLRAKGAPPTGNFRTRINEQPPATAQDNSGDS